MAAKAPAEDVLCEALDYLTKLGCNLRIRSESIKNKKIRREKPNVLSLRKAANKVLLICELSKKSIVNVETGVQKILQELCSSQKGTGTDGTSSLANNPTKPKYFYIEYQSRKLRMRKEISLKQYTSARVVAKCIPKSMIDKYPVYYDCKLYRLRKREKALKNERKNKNEDNKKTIDDPRQCRDASEKTLDGSTEPVIHNNTNEDVSESDDNKTNSEVKNTKKDTQNSTENVSTHRDISKDTKKSEKLSKTRKLSAASVDSQKTSRPKSNSEERSGRASKSRSPKPNSEQKSQRALKSQSPKPNSEERSRRASKSQSPKPKSEERSRRASKSRSPKRKGEGRSRRASKSQSPKPKSDERSRRASKSQSPKPKSEDRSRRPSKSRSPKRKGEERSQRASKSRSPTTDKEQNADINNKPHQKINAKSDKSLMIGDKDKNKHSVQKEKRKNLIESDKQDSDSSIEINTKKDKTEDTNRMKKKIIQDSSDEDNSESNKNRNEKEQNLKPKKQEVECQEEIPEKSKSCHSGDKIDNSVEIIDLDLSQTPEKNYSDNEKSNDSEIKPIIKCVSLSKLLKPDVLKKNIIGTEKNQTINMKKSDKVALKDDSDEDYWTQKRKEVQSFKAKQFTINIARLPKLSETYLEKLDLKKITCNGKNICEFSMSSSHKDLNKDEENVQSKKNTEKSDEDCSQITSSKRALLNDSESDSDLITVANNVKNTLLNESDSEYDIADLNNDTQPNEIGKESVKESLLNDSEDSETNNADEADKGACSEENKKSTDEQNDQFKQGNDQAENSGEMSEPINAVNEKSPERISSDKDINDTIKSSSDDQSNTPLSQRRKSNQLTPKHKRIRESMRAKKMLLTYSSSETEDEQLKGVLNEIKESLLNASDDEDKLSMNHKAKSSSSEDIVSKVKKDIQDDSDDDMSSSTHKRKKHRRKLDSEDEFNKSKTRKKMVRSKSKPGNCSSQNSDAQDSNDKDIDGLTNLNTLNKRAHRKRSDDSTEESTAPTTANTRSSKKKPTGLICDEEMLKAESSSDAASIADDDNEGNIEEELPTVTIPNFNGGDHLVKEDLLGESESSESHNEDTNKDDSDSETKRLNSRRKKANAISSDSEVGSSRQKDADVKLSDFEDSDDDTSEPKRAKRKKVASDSDGSADNSDSGKKKRRRIKSVKDSDASDSESETEGRNKHGRKNIRKVMGKNQLEEATKKAAREEKERIARIAERQKLYNNLEFDESGKPDEVVLDKVVLDFDPETKEPLIEVDRGLVKKLKPHQANGIKFMWDACFESVKRIKKDRGSGCILAHCMGLGKTLQVVTLTHTLLTHSEFTRVNRVLVVCPLSTVLNWVNEFRMWLKHAVTDHDVDVYELSRFKQNSERSFQLRQWFLHGGVCVLGYEMFRNLSADNAKKYKKKMLKDFQESLVDPGPDLVVCDEGHLLKNEKTSLSQSMNRVRTRRRIVLTGTPLQNNLKEYYCMVQFVKPNLLGKYNEYLNRFVNPITNGQYTDSTEHDIKIMKRRSHVLHKMLDGAVQRRDYGVLAPFLPPKHEYVLFITLSEVQIKLYQHYLDNFSRRPLPGKSSGFLFPDFQSLQRIWTHPLVLKYNSERYEIMQQKKRDKEEEDSEGSLVDFIDDDSTAEESSTEESTDDSSDMSDDSRKKSKKKKKKKSGKKGSSKEAKTDAGGRPRRGTRANPVEHDEEIPEDITEVKNENPTEWWIKLVEEDELEDMRNSHKLILLFDILRQCEAIGDKLLVFSQSLYSLDLIEHFLGKVDDATQEGRIDDKLGGHVGTWSPGLDYFRLDGSTSCENRSIWCKNFNREDNPRARLFLISTRAGGLGINLVAANRVVIFDVSWNPSHDVQSIFRVYRFGQKKPCYVYRFLAMGTMEEKIYERQVTKQAISKRVIDEQQIDRHYAENDLAELYQFSPAGPSPRPLPPLPKDRLFAEMLREHEHQIYKYHEHDSLLENKEEETLSEEERKAAWEDFENEKNRPPPAPFAAPWPMHNGMMGGLLAQQQQQLALAALSAMLRKDMPNLSDDQLRAMLPLIYNANPQLMQKMSEMYKYGPGMMNPAMMNPGVMNAGRGAAGGMSGMGGASGLQYEPPWQRQQQQQMQLQQLMQHQNPMGAKFYAGGLGSRDPVAMALQQQRAREIMLGGGGGAGAGAGRPRGRPPLTPRAPPPPPDVVNLDSD